MKELKEANEEGKYLKSNINMVIPCLFNSTKPNNIEENIFNLTINSNNGKDVLGRKYYFSFIPKGIYENLFNKICTSIGSAMKFWKNGFIVTSKDTYLTLEIIQTQKSENTIIDHIIFIQSIGSLQSQFISSFLGLNLFKHL